MKLDDEAQSIMHRPSRSHELETQLVIVVYSDIILHFGFLYYI
jgi:hypothetical protein